MTERIRLNDGFDHLRDRIQDLEEAAEPQQVQSRSFLKRKAAMQGKPNPFLPAPPASAAHQYISTACQHGKHELCRRTCKYCGASCQCQQCEHAAAPPPDAELITVRIMGKGKTEEFASLPGYRPPEGVEVISREPLWKRKEPTPPAPAAPSCCGDAHMKLAALEDLLGAIGIRKERHGNEIRYVNIYQPSEAPAPAAAPLDRIAQDATNEIAARFDIDFATAGNPRSFGGLAAIVLNALRRVESIENARLRAELEQVQSERNRLRKAVVWFGNRSGQFKHYWKQLQAWKAGDFTHAEGELVRRDYEKYSEMAEILAAAEQALQQKG